MRNPEIAVCNYAEGDGDVFPIGMRVLIVDDDPLCLIILKKMLLQCKYHVTACSRAIEALQLLREKKSKFDIVMSDVYMPDIDGFKLLELIGLEMDLPVIMMSANGETSVVMKGITHGACDYLLKPVRIEELRNIWQHVIRKRGTKEAVKEESSGEWDESEKFPECSSKKRKENFDNPDDQIDDISNLKKPRVVWSGDLHRLFVKAVNQLGVDKAVPKRILEIMNVQGLSRENVASHLQKYRLGLKRLSGVELEPHPIASFQADDSGAFGGSMCVRPGGGKGGSSSANNTPRCSSSSGVFAKGVNQLDPGTLAALKQLQTLQRHHGGSPGSGKMRQSLGAGNPLHRTCSIELGSLKMQHEDWFGASSNNNNAIKEERISPPDISSPGSGSTSNNVEEMDISTAGAAAQAFELGKIVEECTNVAGGDQATDFDYFVSSPGFSFSHVLQHQQHQHHHHHHHHHQQENWSAEY